MPQITRQDIDEFIKQEQSKINEADRLSSELEKVRFKLVNPKYYLLKRKLSNIVNGFQLGIFYSKSYYHDYIQTETEKNIILNYLIEKYVTNNTTKTKQKRLGIGTNRPDENNNHENSKK